MKRTLNIDLISVLIGAVLGFLLCQSQCSGGDCPEIVGSDTIIIPGDTVLTEIEVDRPYPVWRERVIPGRIDTIKIIEEFFTKYFYSDTISEDSNFIAVINDTLFGNQIISRRFFHQNLRQTAIIVNNELLNPPRLKLFFGGFISAPTFGAGGSLHLVTKRDLMLNYGYNFMSANHQVGLAVKLRLRK